MTSRVSRQLLSSSFRVSARLTPANGSLQALRASSRRMSSTVEGKKSSDLPWIIGSAVVFGPALLYLLSPSARKTAPHKPHDAHKSQSHAPMPMKDDEGTVVDISESIQKSEATDAPQSSSAEPEPAKEEVAEPVATSPEETKPEAEAAPKESAGSKDEAPVKPEGETPKTAEEKEKTEKTDS